MASILEARYCESLSKMVMAYKENEKFVYKAVSVINLDDARDVARSNGYTGEVKIVEQAQLFVKPVAA